MAYSDFTFAGIIGACGLSIVEQDDLFSNVPLVDLPNVLQTILTRHLPLASMLNTEKARSELLIAPMLFELKYLHADRIGVFSGIEFSVDAAIGLNGPCDFILARNPQQLFLKAPVCMLLPAVGDAVRD